MVNKKRNYGLDLIKIIACILVITLHSLDPTGPVMKNNTFDLGLYYAGTMAIPIFFMGSGYFVLNKKSISYAYSFRRIRNILAVVLSWLLIFSLLRLIVKHKFNFLDELGGSAFTGVPNSHFYHFWFFWSLIIMLLIAPILVWILQRGFKYFLILTIIMTIICWVQDISLHIGYAYVMRNIPQVFRLNIWIEYYLLGGLVGNIHFDRIKQYMKSHFSEFVILDFLLYAALIGYSLWNKTIIGWVYAEANYNNIFVMLIGVISMTLFAISAPKNSEAIEFVIKATMGIYILQSFVISLMLKISFLATYPILVIPLTFVICLIVVEIALKIPIVRRLFIL